MKEKIVLVTGANKGIGFGIAKHLGLNGWKVIIGARNEQRAEKAINELEKVGSVNFNVIIVDTDRPF